MRFVKRICGTVIRSNECRGDKMYQSKDSFFNELFEENYVKIRTWAYRHLGDYTLAEDIAQETFLILVLRIDVAMAHPAPRAWLYKVAQN